MKTVLFISIMLCSVAMADVPEVVITHAAMSSKGYITVAGHLKSVPAEPLGIQIKNGGLTYATITDPEGKWGLLVASYSGKVYANAFDLKNSSDRSAEVYMSVPVE